MGTPHSLWYPASKEEGNDARTELYARLLSLGAGWRVNRVELDMERDRIDVWVETREGGAWACPECKTTGSIYDHVGEQVWRHLDTCQCRTYVHARLPRTACKEHGVRQVAAPWAGPRSGFTLLMEKRLIDTLECDVTGCCRLTGVSWDQGWGIVERAVRRGRDRKPHRIPAYIGIDEKSFAKRHNYETLEHKILTADGDERLKGTKHLWLANEENVPEWRREEFDVIRKGNLRTGRAWAIKEALRQSWNYTYGAWAEKFFKRWYFWATHSKLAPIIKAAKTLKAHLPNMLTYFKHRISNATSEGLNSKIQIVKQMACGFCNRDHYKLAIYFEAKD